MSFSTNKETVSLRISHFKSVLASSLFVKFQGVLGVPQGSIIGLILFHVYVNDIMENLSAGTSFPLYADDAKCARVINDLNDCYTLQNDLAAIAGFHVT